MWAVQSKSSADQAQARAQFFYSIQEVCLHFRIDYSYRRFSLAQAKGNRERQTYHYTCPYLEHYKLFQLSVEKHAIV